MNKTTLLIICFSLLIFCCATKIQAQKSKVIADGATVKQVASGYTFTEGPAVDAMGNVFFTDQPNDRIIKWAIDGKVSVFMENTDRSNGMYFDHQGNLISCADEKNQLVKIKPNKEIEVLVNDFEGKKLNGPNDLWIDPQGGIYFTDPFYKRKWWKHTEPELEKQDVYYLSPDKTSLKVVASNFKTPNGIVGTANGKKLYISDLGDKKTYVYKVGPEGVLSNRKLFVEDGSDGMTLDHKGNLYITNTKGVTVFNKRGKQIEQIKVDESWTANVVFGGIDQKTLFITARKSLFTLEMKVRGIR